ncbi:MAG: hypothetical protein A2008_05230 [Candidatus Wallbacteria bacterium GWC2_49_35]|uniref:Type II secretion system protein GspG C-terminal domain-containing protein n=1 Tax=Candidatus Wallbacteria bacterium GWC2_49_35 TaxID=1817813 RepID=A0A1F7WUF9_9BACT|nr:MAG: hypothetical protein A2008_05230 [Candidatus Wallbacteria bacterium GWC2_49_35]HBC76551.1 hypothetical protein [Candidatus Wallbacteria bacterium]
MKITDAGIKTPGIRSKKALGALIWIFTFSAAFLLVSWRVMPIYGTAARLAREQELVFVLKSYKRAIMKYKKVYGAGPYKLADLIKSQPNPRFIRQLYDDPFCTEEIKIKNHSNGLVTVTAANNEIVNVKTSSGEKSAGGVEYRKWYADSALRLCVE